MAANIQSLPAETMSAILSHLNNRSLHNIRASSKSSKRSAAYLFGTRSLNIIRVELSCADLSILHSLLEDRDDDYDGKSGEIMRHLTFHIAKKYSRDDSADIRTLLNGIMHKALEVTHMRVDVTGDSISKRSRSEYASLVMEILSAHALPKLSNFDITVAEDRNSVAALDHMVARHAATLKSIDLSGVTINAGELVRLLVIIRDQTNVEHLKMEWIKVSLGFFSEKPPLVFPEGRKREDRAVRNPVTKKLEGVATYVFYEKSFTMIGNLAVRIGTNLILKFGGLGGYDPDQPS